MLQRELLEVIRKYVNVDVDAVKVDLIKDGDNEVLDISVALPEERAAAGLTPMSAPCCNAGDGKPTMLTLADIAIADVAALLARYGLQLAARRRRRSRFPAATGASPKPA